MPDRVHNDESEVRPLVPQSSQQLTEAGPGSAPSHDSRRRSYQQNTLLNINATESSHDEIKDVMSMQGHQSQSQSIQRQSLLDTTDSDLPLPPSRMALQSNNSNSGSCMHSPVSASSNVSSDTSSLKNLCERRRSYNTHFEDCTKKQSKQQTQKANNKNPKSLMSHLSYIMTDEESIFDNDNFTDENGVVGSNTMDNDVNYAGSNSRQIFLKTISRQRTKLKRGLILLTIFFVLATIVHRNFRTDGNANADSNADDNSSQNVDDVKIKNKEFNSTNTGSATICAEPSLTNDEAIQALQNSSSVTNQRNGAVAADDERCSELGVSIMRDLNGNAVDAAIATALCLGLVNPASSGIGGGAFILIHCTPRADDKDGDGSGPRSTPFIDRRENPHPQTYPSQNSVPSSGRTMKRTEVIDCRETAPGNATYDMFENLPTSASTIGSLSIAVPGELRGLELAHARYGKLSWKEIVQPVIDLGEKGVHVHPFLAEEIRISKQRIDQFEATKRILTKDNDGETYLVEGDVMTRPQYVQTLKNIAEYGADYIYRGEVAAQIAKEIQAGGGIISAKDIEDYKPILRDPVVSKVDGFNIVSIPPPSSGGAAIIGALRFLSGYLKPFATFADTLSKHRLIEAFKHVFAIRMSLSDPDYFTNVTEAAVKDLISGPLIGELRKNTLDDRVLPLSCYGGKWALLKNSDDTEEAVDAHEGDRRLKSELRDIHRRARLFNYLEDHGTSHLSVVDKDRNSVSITSSVNNYFGSNFASSSTGIIFNDVMDDFATPGRPNVYGLQPAKSNYIAPMKRPLSSMAPTMVFDANKEDSSDMSLGKLLLVLGASGGPKIITAVLQVILNHLFLGMPLYKSIASPRIHNQLLYHGAAATGYDKSRLLQGPLIETPERTRDALKRRKQIIIPLDYLGTCQAVSIDSEVDELTAVSDPRKYGKSAGY